jgi:hypothetical protein
VSATVVGSERAQEYAQAQKSSGQGCIIDPVDMRVQADFDSVLTELFD